MLEKAFPGSGGAGADTWHSPGVSKGAENSVGPEQQQTLAQQRHAQNSLERIISNTGPQNSQHQQKMSSQPKMTKHRQKQAPVNGSHWNNEQYHPCLAFVQSRSLQPGSLLPHPIPSIQPPQVTTAFQEFSQFNSSMIPFYLQNKAQSPQHGTKALHNGIPMSLSRFLSSHPTLLT